MYPRIEYLDDERYAETDDRKIQGHSESEDDDEQDEAEGAFR